MPSHRHELLVATFREQPALLAALVHTLIGRTLDPNLEPADSALRYVDSAEVRPDLVLTHGAHWTVVEIQDQPDHHKQRRWILAASLLFDQKRALGDVIVITARRSVAKWAKTVAHVCTPLGTRLELTPVILHVDPETTDRLLSEQHPELALIATWAVAHRHGRAAWQVVERALEVTEKLPPALQQAQRGAILGLLSEQMVAWLKERMMDPQKIPMTPAARKLRDELMSLGRAEGLTEGLAQGKREALLDLLSSRGLAVSAKERAAITACADPAVLRRWIAKAVTAASVAEVLAPEAPARRARAKPAKRPARATKRVTKA